MFMLAEETLDMLQQEEPFLDLKIDAVPTKLKATGISLRP